MHDTRLSNQKIAHIFQKALNENLVSDQINSLIFHDLNATKNRLHEIECCFPKNAEHTVAIKANPLPKLLKLVTNYGFGLEAASLAEVRLAEQASSQQIFFDSPCKTIPELSYTLQNGITIHADSFQECERIETLIASNTYNAKVGVRVNPQSGAGSIAQTYVAGFYSKFGVPLQTERNKIIEFFDRFPWLDRLHVHTGSQSAQIEQIASNISQVYELAMEINHKTHPGRVTTLNIGGGLPVPYQNSDTHAKGIHALTNELRAKCPGLFDGTFRPGTEFGRYIFANAGWAASKVEYVKKIGEQHIAVIHLGADMFLRRAYRPEDWFHEIVLLDKDGVIKTGANQPTTIAGPLCFSGDVLAEQIPMPEITPGDWVIIKDCGAYTYGMWSRYNSRPMPGVWGYGPDGSFSCLKEAETTDKAAAFWR